MGTGAGSTAFDDAAGRRREQGRENVAFGDALGRLGMVLGGRKTFAWRVIERTFGRRCESIEGSNS